jgi:hypothetical protein
VPSPNGVLNRVSLTQPSVIDNKLGCGRPGIARSGASWKQTVSEGNVSETSASPRKR